MVKTEKVKILKHLISNSDNDFTIREISLIRKINYKSAYQALEKLEMDGSVIIKKKGNTKLCSFSRNFTELVFIAEKERLKDALKNSDLKVIYKEFQKIKTQAIILLFGSSVKGTRKKGSDFDLLIISQSTENVEKVISWVPRKIDVTSLSYDDFEDMLESKRFSVVSEAIKNNIILLGIEDYYRFIENAR